MWLFMGQSHLTEKKIFISRMGPCFQLSMSNKEFPVNVHNKQEQRVATGKGRGCSHTAL